jgi:hypothetical protein
MAVLELYRNLVQHLRKASTSTFWPADCLRKHEHGGRELERVPSLLVAGQGKIMPGPVIGCGLRSTANCIHHKGM